MSENQQIVAKYIDGFNKSDHQQILSCLTDDVEWIIPGAFHISGKTAFDKEIENDAFVGRPIVKTTRVVEQDDVIVAEGSVHAEKKGGGFLEAVFCDVFLMRDGRIRRLTSYVIPVN